MYIGIEVVWCIIIELISMNSSNRYDVSQTHQATPAPKKTPKAVEQLQVGSAMEDFVAGLRKKQQEEIGKKASENLQIVPFDLCNICLGPLFLSLLLRTKVDESFTRVPQTLQGRGTLHVFIPQDTFGDMES